MNRDAVMKSKGEMLPRNNASSLSSVSNRMVEASEPRHETDTVKMEAMNVLCEQGVFKRVADLQLYHGRSNTDGKKFAVSTSYDNRLNPDGIPNVNRGISALSTTEDFSIAEEFAKVRAMRDRYRRNKLNSVAEIHRIISNDPDAVILDWSATDRALVKEQTKVEGALKQLALPASLEYAPIQLWAPEGVGVHRQRILLDYGRAGREIFPAIPRDFTKQAEHLGMVLMGSYHDFSYRNLKEVADAIGINISDDALSDRCSMESRVLDQIARVSNSYNAVCKYPCEVIAALLNDNTSVPVTLNDDVGDIAVDVPISLTYIAKWAKANHIIGAAYGARSATIGKEITTISLFDLSKTKTPEQLQAERQERTKRLGKLACALTMQPNARQDYGIDIPYGDKLMDVLSGELWATPERIVNCARKVPLGVPGIDKYWETFGDIFDADAGNWEGYTLGEHTETVLRNFENSYADKLPAKLLPLMRLCLVAHDIGKPIAAHNKEKSNQDKYNASWAMVFLAKAGVDRQMAGIIIDMITSGKNLAAQAYVDNARKNINHPNEDKMNELRSFCQDSLERYGMKAITGSDVDGMADLCLILLTCDAAAYTTMGITHDAKALGVYYNNYPSFQKSFRRPDGLTGDDSELRSANRTYLAQ